MSGWGTNVLNYLKKLYDYWQEVIIYTIAAIFFILAFTVPYLLWIWHTPPSLLLLFSVIFTPFFILLELVTLSFMKSAGFGRWGEWDAKEPTKWADFRKYYRKNKKIIVFVAAANVFYLICLMSYFLMMGQKMNQALFSQRTGVFIFLFWVIMNGLIAILYCLSFWSEFFEYVEERYQK
jgi:hypothetical protein